MIDVGVRDHHRVDRLDIERKVAINFKRLFAMPLIEPAIQQQPPAADFNQMHRAGHRAGSALELQLYVHLDVEGTVPLGKRILIRVGNTAVAFQQVIAL